MHPACATIKTSRPILYCMISDDWLVGFVEGEGCFNVGLMLATDRRPRKRAKKSNRKKPSVGIRLVPSFRITLREDDWPLLEQVKEKLGCGGIYLNKRSPLKPNARDLAHYYVVGTSNLLKVRQFFEMQSFYSKKKRDFELWCQCLDLISQKRHLEKSGLLEICKIRDLMNSRLAKGNRTASEIEQILNSNREHIMAHVAVPST